MKLSSDTLAVFKNFASISSGLYVPGGSKIRVKDLKNRVLAQAVVMEEFPSFCVTDLNKFLGILTADKDVDVDFKGSDVVLTMLGGKSKIKYRCAPQNLVNIPKSTEFAVDDPICEFTLTKDQLAYIQKVLSLLQLPNVAISSNGNSKYEIRVYDPKNDGENSQSLELDAVGGEGKKFNIIFDQEVLNFVEGDYVVRLGQQVTEFKNKKFDVTYWVAPELGSSYEQ
jgi:hypothetical protein